ncbi:sodium-dependent organic anion transporter [Monodelphis domestica]|uniref:Solute carrier family 10 member 6 n=1 Tax=Monodelphis domestica TaxID=13616 RepID=F6ZZW4_MONDO|nr:sodium-dependent organic anion transporter [Monodelphis domestica]
MKMVNCSSSLACPHNLTEEKMERGLENHGNLELIFMVVLAVMMALVMFSLGCTVDIKKLWLHIRRPWGIAVGLLCQYGLMPFIAYLLAISFSLPPIQAIAVLILGCSPGGTISNIFTYWVDGDMDLSICMTTCSTVVALGMMPLCLYIYTQSWDFEQTLTVPYKTIGITLLCLIVPVAFGIFVNFKWPKQSKIILRLGAIVGVVLLLVVTVAGVVLAKGSLNSSISLLVISFVFPLTGHIIGLLLALLTRQSWKRCKTISLETGAQNIQMCSTMLQLSFSSEHVAQIFSFPLSYGLFQFLDGFLIISVYQTYKRLFKKRNEEKELTCNEVSELTESNAKHETSSFLERNDPIAAMTTDLSEEVLSSSKL